MYAVKGQFIRIKKDVIANYETRGYVHNEEGYEVINIEHTGVFIREFNYIILHSDYEIVAEPEEDTEHVLIKIKNRMYGDYFCSCGCNKLLGDAYGIHCYGVGYVDDDEGYEWRMFRPECWEKIKSLPLEQIYNKYKASRLA